MKTLIGKRVEAYVEPWMYLGVIMRQMGSFVHVKTLLKRRPTPVEFIVKTTFIASIED